MRKIVCIIGGLLFLTSCSDKDTDIPTVITGDNVVYAESMTVTCNGFVEDDGGSSAYARGICYKKGNVTPTIADNIESGGSGKGIFSCNLQLSEAGTYSYCAYATNSNGIAYGAVRTFNISNGSIGEEGLPGVITGECNVNEATMTVTCNGYVENDGGASVYSRGICYLSGIGIPTIADDKVTGGSGLGNYSCTLNIDNEGYYSYCAYATNSSGTAYGEVKKFLIGTPMGSVSVTFDDVSWTDDDATLLGPGIYSPNWFQLITYDPLGANRMIDVTIDECTVGTYTGHAISGSYNTDYEFFDTEYDIDGFFSVMAQVGGIEWHAKSFTINVIKYDKVLKVGSITVDAVMYNCNNAFTSEGGNVGLNAAETKTLHLVASNVPFYEDKKKMVYTSFKEKVLAVKNSKKNHKVKKKIIDNERE